MMFRKKGARRAIVGLLVAPGCVPAIVLSQNVQITADKTVKGTQPVIGVSHGVPVIQITPPSARGVSHNRFTHLNVGQAGLVLNNSAGTSKTQIAGEIAGNPFLGHKRANIILNEVTAANPTMMRGMLEVAGQRAHIIVANPSGITCDGCGFLNASRATLTTGRPQVGPKGDITLNVTQGVLAIKGAGLNGTQAAQVDLLARALVLNADVWADRLSIVVGAASVDATSTKVQGIEGKGRKPKVTLDTSALGGMYANSIRLVGTEAGVGVNVLGDLVAITGDLSLTAAGNVLISSNVTVSAKEKLSMDVAGTLDTRHANLHAKNVTISARTLQNQAGNITAGNTATLRIQGSVNNEGGVLAATAKNDIHAINVNNAKGTIAGGSVVMTVKADLNNESGLMFADHEMTLSAGQLFNQNTISSEKSPAFVQSKGKSSIRLSTGISAAVMTLHTGMIENHKGNIQTGRGIVINTSALNNHTGLIAAKADARITTVSLTNKLGTISAGKNLAVSVKSLNDLGWLQAGEDISFSFPHDLHPVGNFIAGRDLTLNVGKTLVNTTRLGAGRDLVINTGTLSNQPSGELLGGRNVTINVAKDVNNHGLIDGQHTRINAEKIYNDSRIYGDKVTLSADVVMNEKVNDRNGLIASRGPLYLAFSTLRNHHHGLIYAETYLNIGRQITKSGDVSGNADYVSNRSSTIEAGKSIVLASHRVDNENADFFAEEVEVSSQRKVYFTPEGTTQKYDAATHWLCDKVTRACSHDPNWLNDDPERRFLLPSNKYPESRYGPEFHYALNMHGKAGFSAPIPVSYVPAVGGAGDGKKVFLYARDSAIWSVFGVQPPSHDLPPRKTFANAPPRDRKYPQNGGDDSYPLAQGWFRASEYPQGFQRPSRKRMANDQAAQNNHIGNAATPYEQQPEYLAYKKAHLALDERIQAFNRDFQQRLVKNFIIYDVNEIVLQSRMVRSDPARIVSRGSLTIRGEVKNEKSQIAAGGKLSVTGPAINNLGATGWRTTIHEGQATATQARRSDRKAHRSSYKKTIKKEPFDLPVGVIRSGFSTNTKLPARRDTSQMYGTLLAGRDTYLKAQGNLINSGTIGAAQTIRVNALNIVNYSGGYIQANKINLNARDSITNIASRIHGGSVSLQAGQNVNLISTKASEKNAHTQGTFSTGRSTVMANDLTVQAGKDITMLASTAEVKRDAKFQAGRDIHLNTVKITHKETLSSGRNQHHKLSTQTTVGSVASAERDLLLKAGRDVRVNAAEINGQSKLGVLAGRDVHIIAGVNKGSATDKYREKSSGVLSSKTEKTVTSQASIQAQGATLTGGNVGIVAGRDVLIQGANVGAKANLGIAALGKIDIQPSHQQVEGLRREEVSKKGMGANGGMGAGSSKRVQTTLEKNTVHKESLLGSLHGHTKIQAGQAVNIVASKVVAPKGDIDIGAPNVNIASAQNTHYRKETLRQKTAGVSVGASIPMFEALKAAVETVSALDGKGTNPIVQSLAVASAGMEAKDTVENVKQGPSAAVASVKISIQAGASTLSSKSVVDKSTVAGASIAAGRNVEIKTTGKKKDSGISVVASTVSAKGDVTLKSDGNISLLAEHSSVTTKQNNKGAGAALGIGVSVGADGASMGIQASANLQKGKAHGRESQAVNAKVLAGNKVALESASDTTVKGGVVSAKAVNAKVGGSLSIESVQDTASYKSNDKSAGGSVTFGMGFSGSANVALNKVTGKFASVREQSGIQAGDDGFDISVKGNTNLKGAVIASTDNAVSDHRNRLTTGTLTSSDIKNYSQYKAQGIALSGGMRVSSKPDSQSGNTESVKQEVSANAAPGLSKHSKKETSVTRSGVSAGAVTVRDDEKQRQLTGQAALYFLEKLDINVRTDTLSKGLEKKWNPETLRATVAAEAAALSSFVRHASATIDTYVTETRTDLQQQKEQASSDQERQDIQQKINSLHTQERLLNVIVGAVSGSTPLAIVHAAISQAADDMRQYTITDSKKFRGVTDGKTSLDNQNGVSAGIRNDGFKAAGVRVELDVVCGKNNERCVPKRDVHGEVVFDKRSMPELHTNLEGQVLFDVDSQRMSLEKYLKTAEGSAMTGPTGGVQGKVGTLMGMPYAPGGVLDFLHEAFSGAHDFMGGTLSGLYDAEGNAARGRHPAVKRAHDVWSAVALVPAAPFALAEVFPSEVWLAIDVLLKAAK